MYISGIGRTKFGSLPQTLPELAYEAMYNAIADSNVDIRDIDAIFVSNFLGGTLNGRLHLNSIIASLLPGMNVPIVRVETATLMAYALAGAGLVAAMLVAP
jgi:acetyl-CoA C-acetyltransferase